MKRTIIIDTDEHRVELLEEGYNIVEDTVYNKDINEEAERLLNLVLLDSIPY